MIREADDFPRDRGRRPLLVVYHLCSDHLLPSVGLLSPFVFPLRWAGVLCYALNPVYTWMVKATPSCGY